MFSIRHTDRKAPLLCGKALPTWTAARLLLLALVFTPLQTRSAGEQPGLKSNNLPLISTTRQFFALSAAEAKRGYPVHLRGVVTYCDPEWHLLFLEDSSGPMFIPLPDADWKGLAGDLVEVEGTSGAERGIPLLAGVRPRTVGKGSLPQPISMPLLKYSQGRRSGARFRFRAPCGMSGRTVHAC